MSEPQKRACRRCGADVLHEWMIGLGASFPDHEWWRAVPHKAPCGLLCVAGVMVIGAERPASGSMHGARGRCAKCGDVPVRGRAS